MVTEPQKPHTPVTLSKPGFGAALVFAGLILSGCAGMKRIETTSADNNQKINLIQQRLEAMNKAIDDLNINQGGATNSMRADLTMLIKQLDSQLEQMKAEMDEFQYRFRQLEKKMDQIAGQRLLVTHSSADSSDSTGGSTTTKIIGGLDIEKLYNQAREDYISGKYDLAFSGFETVLQKDPTGNFKDNALYWMGECFYKQKKYEKAIEYYNRSVNEYPQGNKLCSCYFKVGLSYGELKKKKQRNEAFQKVIDKCPGTNEANRAKSLME